MVVRVLRPFLLGLCLTIALATLVWISRPTSVSASTERSMASTIVSLMNDDRAALGLRPLRVDSRLASLAGDRAAWMASSGLMTHQSAGGDVWDAIASRGLAAFSSGEAIGYTDAPWGDLAARYLYELWKASPEHWALMMSSTFNYVGVGVGYRASAAQTFASLVFAEAPDGSPPVAQMTVARVSGRSVVFTWTGRVVELQTHTAALRDYDVQLRIDDGPWSTIRRHTTATQLALANGLPGHRYGVRVRDRDTRNNLSGWTSPRTVRVP